MRDWVFGYGSLVPAATDRAAPAPCLLHGWTRRWGVAMDNRVDLPAYKHYLDEAGRRPDVLVCFLDIAAGDGVVNGACLAADAETLRLLDRRERNYRRIEVTDRIAGGPPGRIWAYEGLPEARARRDAGIRDGTLVVSRAYLEQVRRGFDELGELAAFERLSSPVPCPVVPLTLVPHAGSHDRKAVRR